MPTHRARFLERSLKRTTRTNHPRVRATALQRLAPPTAMTGSEPTVHTPPSLPSAQPLGLALRPAADRGAATALPLPSPAMTERRDGGPRRRGPPKPRRPLSACPKALTNGARTRAVFMYAALGHQAQRTPPTVRRTTRQSAAMVY